MDAHRLRVKIGSAEFEAEGREEVVRDQFNEFKALLEKSPPIAIKDSEAPQDSPHSGDKVANLGRLQVLFRLESRKGRAFMTLRSPKAGQVPSSLLILLLGYRKLGMNEVPGALLKEALERSGISVSRLDRAAVPLEKENLVRRTGTKRASRYWLTNVGIIRAETDASKMLEVAS